MASVTLKNIDKFYGATRIIKNVTLDVHDKEFLVLVGPSGCGKTTLLRIISGLEETQSGEILIGDRRVNGVAPKDRDIAMIFQNYALYPHMSVYDNMAFGLKLRNVPKSEIEHRVSNVSRMLELEPFLKRKPKELSGGQRQRVAMGRAIVREPKVFLMDEPLSNLDAKLRVQMRMELQKLHQRLGITTLYVTHDQTEAMTLGTRIVVLKDGEIQQIDTPTNLYEAPANIFTAGFIGSPSMNLIAMTVEKNALRAKDFQITLPLDERLSSYLGRKIILGIRPEDLYPKSTDSPLPYEYPLTVGVEAIESLGSETFLHLKKGDFDLTARVSPHFKCKIGDPIDLVIDLRRMHLFDSESGQALK